MASNQRQINTAQIKFTSSNAYKSKINILNDLLNLIPCCTKSWQIRKCSSSQYDQDCFLEVFKCLLPSSLCTHTLQANRPSKRYRKFCLQLHPAKAPFTLTINICVCDNNGSSCNKTQRMGSASTSMSPWTQC